MENLNNVSCSADSIDVDDDSTSLQAVGLLILHEIKESKQLYCNEIRSLKQEVVNLKNILIEKLPESIKDTGTPVVYDEKREKKSFSSLTNTGTKLSSKIFTSKSKNFNRGSTSTSAFETSKMNLSEFIKPSAATNFTNIAMTTTFQNQSSNIYLKSEANQEIPVIPITSPKVLPSASEFSENFSFNTGNANHPSHVMLTPNKSKSAEKNTKSFSIGHASPVSSFKFEERASTSDVLPNPKKQKVSHTSAKSSTNKAFSMQQEQSTSTNVTDKPVPIATLYSSPMNRRKTSGTDLDSLFSASNVETNANFHSKIKTTKPGLETPEVATGHQFGFVPSQATNSSAQPANMNMPEFSKDQLEYLQSVFGQKEITQGGVSHNNVVRNNTRPPKKQSATSKTASLLSKKYSMIHGKLNKNLVNQPGGESKKLFYCGICNKGFVNRRNTITHLINIHDSKNLDDFVKQAKQPKLFYCQLCKKEFVNKGNTKKHMVNIHNMIANENLDIYVGHCKKL